MRFLLDFFANWTFDKVMDYTLAAVIWFVFKSKSKQNDYPITSKIDAAIETKSSFYDRYRYVCFSDNDPSLYV